MPGRNIRKIFAENSYYHVYNRGINKENVFRDEQDYAVFLNLFKRYLSEEPTKDNKGRAYPWLHNDIELLAFCLMPNHFHALIFQHERTAMTQLFKSIITTYGMYFNKKYKRAGPLFQSNFRAHMITDDAYFQHISRYIHLNPDDYRHWPYSSLPYYLQTQSAPWVNTTTVMNLFDNRNDKYSDFLSDYEDYRRSLKLIHNDID